MRSLFIYDKDTDQIVYIKNSGDYPNMRYNKKLDCIDAWLFTGSTTTVFLRLQGDTLHEFASVDDAEYTTVKVIDNAGHEHDPSEEKEKSRRVQPI